MPVVDRQPLLRPLVPNEVWSADFVFDRTAEGRVLKCLTIVDDATTEAVAIVPARALGGLPVTRVLEQLARQPRAAAGAPHRQRPRVLRARHAHVGARARPHAAADRTPGKPTQNAYVESFNGRFRDECLNEHWFTSLAHAQAVIETWRREYNEERPKKGLGGLTPAAYAKTLMKETSTVTAGL